ncbi:hypothetical protein GUJ93_ZPchr0013g36792 [Zizania palustris]|uniref:Uncharacterized protein n=1 Tax=Zizania palustris TaxID=103762 RepID=A0A8J5WZK0_ZIZPA|nr:hypothetical protein GUJ93_ZPchr0013g36792 [Zizania palustris]
MDMDKATTAAEVVGVGLGIREGGVAASKARNARISVRRPPIGMDLGMDTEAFLELYDKIVAKRKRRNMEKPVARLARISACHAWMMRARNAWRMRARRRAAAAAAAPAESAAAPAPLRLFDEERPPAAAASAAS